VGTYFSIKNAAGPRERVFMTGISAIAWIGISAFVPGLILLPQPFNWLLWAAYVIALPLAIRWSNRRQSQIRAEEAAASHAAPTARGLVRADPAAR
jgi:hypothetical protein